MSDEHPAEVVDAYDFPDQYFEELRRLEGEEMGTYSIVQGGLFRALSDDNEPAFSDKEAMEVTRMLNKQKIDEAEEFVYNKLEQSDKYE